MEFHVGHFHTNMLYMLELKCYLFNWYHKRHDCFKFEGHLGFILKVLVAIEYDHRHIQLNNTPLSKHANYMTMTISGQIMSWSDCLKTKGNMNIKLQHTCW